MEKKTTKKAVKKPVKKVKESAPVKKVAEKKQDDAIDANFDSIIYQEFEPVDMFEIDVPRVVYASLSWTYFKLYVKSFFKK
jgi:hypothetical protein